MIDGLLLVFLAEEEHQATAQGWIVDIGEELRKLAAAVTCHEKDHSLRPLGNENKGSVVLRYVVLIHV